MFPFKLPKRHCLRSARHLKLEWIFDLRNPSEVQRNWYHTQDAKKNAVLVTQHL